MSTPSSNAEFEERWSVKFQGSAPLTPAHEPWVHWFSLAIFLFSYHARKEHSPDDFRMSGTSSATLVPQVLAGFPVGHCCECVLNEMSCPSVLLTFQTPATHLPSPAHIVSPVQWECSAQSNTSDFVFAQTPTLTPMDFRHCRSAAHSWLLLQVCSG